MNKEEKEAIDIVKGITEDDLLNYWEGADIPYNAIQIVLNYIEKLQKELKQKDEVIDYMKEKLNNINFEVETGWRKIEKYE